MQDFFTGIYNHHYHHHITITHSSDSIGNSLSVSAALCLLLPLVDRDSDFPSDWRCHGERCHVTPVDIQEDAPPEAARREMDDNYQLGEAGAVKSVSESSEQTDNAVREREVGVGRTV